MTVARLRKAFCVSILALAAFAGAGSVQAAVYTGNWDPLYGTPFGTMGWRGQATFEFTGSCLVANGSVTSGCLGTGTATVTSAMVEFYDTAFADPDPGQNAPTLATLTWTNPAVSFIAASFVGGVLSSVTTDYLDELGPGKTTGTAVVLGGASTADYSFYLEFLGTHARLTHVKSTGSPSPNSPNCANERNPTDVCGFSLPDPDVDRGTLMTFAPAVPVPEPSTYALMLAGLAALGIAARRRRT